MIRILEGFILGVLLVQFILPILDSLAAVIMTALEAAKGYFGTMVAKHNISIHEIMNPEEENVKHTIGFTLPEEEELPNEEIL